MATAKRTPKRTAAKRSTPAKRSKERPLNAAQKAAVKEAIEDIKNPDRPAIETENAFFRVPGQVFVDVVNILGTLPYGQVGQVMDQLKTLRAEK